MNVIDACIDSGVKRVVALSTDKASSPINLYGATKLASDKLFVAGNTYAGGHDTRFAVVRYGNVMGSRGSVDPVLHVARARRGELPITDARMTRFMITLEQGVEFVLARVRRHASAARSTCKKIPSMKIVDIADGRGARTREHEIIGIRPGEKMHEQMIGEEDAPAHLRVSTTTYKILPAIHDWSSDPAPHQRTASRCADGFAYARDTNTEWMTVETLRGWIAANREHDRHASECR